MADELAVCDNLLSAREDVLGVAFYFPAFKHRVVGGHALRGGGDGVVGVGVPEEDVGVFAGSDDAFFRHAEDARGCGAVELDETLGREAAGVDAEVPEDLEAVFDAGAAVGDFAEVAFAERLLVAMVKGQ